MLSNSELLELVGSEMAKVREALTQKLSWYAAALRIVDTMIQNPLSRDFRDFPSVSDKGFYRQKVPKPMYLNLVKKNLDEFEYVKIVNEQKDLFLADVRLIFENCRAFNPEGPILKLAAELEAQFEDLVVEYRLEDPADKKEIRHLWKNLSPEDKKYAMNEVVAKYEEVKDGIIKREVSRKRLIDFLRARHHRGSSDTDLRLSTHSDLRPVGGIKRPRERHVVDAILNGNHHSEGGDVFFHNIDEVPHSVGNQPAVISLPQNKHSHGFVGSISPIHSVDYPDAGNGVS